MKINPDTTKVIVDGNEIRKDRYRYILLNKPDGYVCSTTDNDGESVLNLVPENLRTKNMFPAGLAKIRTAQAYFSRLTPRSTLKKIIFCKKSILKTKTKKIYFLLFYVTPKTKKTIRLFCFHTYAHFTKCVRFFSALLSFCRLIKIYPQ